MLVWPTPPDALDAAITILVEAFGSYADVSAKLPRSNRPERFVQVERVGGRQDNPAIDNARILIHCFARDVAQSVAMCNTARAALRNAQGTTVTCSTARIFVRHWGNEDGPTQLAHPEIIDYERTQIHGELAIKSN